MEREGGKKRGRHPLYPWAEWLKAGDEPLVLMRGTDYLCTSAMMAIQVRAKVYSRRYGNLTCHVEVMGDPDRLLVTISPSESEGNGI